MKRRRTPPVTTYQEVKREIHVINHVDIRSYDKDPFIINTFIERLEKSLVWAKAKRKVINNRIMSRGD